MCQLLKHQVIVALPSQADLCNLNKVCQINLSTLPSTWINFVFSLKNTFHATLPAWFCGWFGQVGCRAAVTSRSFWTADLYSETGMVFMLAGTERGKWKWQAEICCSVDCSLRSDSELLPLKASALNAWQEVCAAVKTTRCSIFS